MPIGFRHKEWAIVLFATRGLTDFVENALLTIERCGIDVGIVEVVFPASAECEIANVAKVFGARPRILEHLLNVQSVDLPAAYAQYGSPEFNKVMKYRFPALRTIMAEGKRVISSDVDVAWLRSPLAYLSDVLEHFPCAFQTEAVSVFPPMFCVGFCALTDSPACLEIIDHFIARYGEDGAKRPLQPVFRDMLVENPQYLADIFPLPEGLFPNGLLHRAVDLSNEPPVTMSGALQPFIFHGNFARGLENKRRLLTNSRLWLVPENGGLIELGEPIPLFLIEDFVVYEGAEVLPGRDVQIITPREQWAYAVSFGMNSDALRLICSDKTITVNIHLRVDEGIVGVGLLKDGGCEFVVEKAIRAAKDYKAITLRAAVSQKISEIVIRNCRDSGKPSCVSVRSIETRLSRRHDFSS